MEIAFIGLGNMGSGMAANLAKAGRGIRAFDLSPEAVAVAVSAGASAALSVAEACRDADAVVTMLPAAQHVLSVYEDVRAVAPSSALLIDCSTIDVASARAVHDKAVAAGYTMVDAPVSGGVAAANAGTLTFMVGGEAAAFERAQPILGAMGRAVIHAGGPGAGQAAKICNNMLLAITMIGTCEAFALAEKLGLDDQVFFDIASKASGQNWSLTSYCPVPGPVPASPANNDYKPGFMAGLMLKDLTLAMQAARMASAETPLGAHAHALYETLCAEGYAQRDFSVMMERIRG